MTATELLARFRRSIDSIESEIEDDTPEEAAEATPEATEPEPETTPEPETNGHRVFQLDKIGMSQGQRFKAAVSDGNGVLVLVYAPTQDDLAEVFEALGVVY